MRACRSGSRFSKILDRRVKNDLMKLSILPATRGAQRPVNGVLSFLKIEVEVGRWNRATNSVEEGEIGKSGIPSRLSTRAYRSKSIDNLSAVVGALADMTFERSDRAVASAIGSKKQKYVSNQGSISQDQ